jgi:hypothetical protein
MLFCIEINLSAFKINMVEARRLELRHKVGGLGLALACKMQYNVDTVADQRNSPLAPHSLSSTSAPFAALSSPLMYPGAERADRN